MSGLPVKAQSRPLLPEHEAARRALAKCIHIDDVKPIRNVAVAAKAWAREAKDMTMIKQATAIQLSAERRAGELLREMAESGERDKGHYRKLGSQPATQAPPKLVDLGVSKTQSSRWQKLAALDPDKFEGHVERAGTNAYKRMTARFVKEVEIEEAQRRHRGSIEHGCTVDDLVALAESGYRANVIYADPAWEWTSFGPLGRIRSCADHHYPLSTFEEIKALPVAPLAAEDCVLLLWCTWPRLPDGLAVIEAWGFTYKTCGFTWVKTTKNAERVTLNGGGLHTGMGYWTRSNTEYCLLATKGSPSRLAMDVHQVVLAPVGEHSEKPEEVRRRIEQLLAGPYLELYGRKEVPGWTVWGNEIKRGRMQEAAE